MDKKYMVIIDCCNSGYCIECHKRGTLGRVGRVIHSDNISLEYAQKVAEGWKSSHPEIVEMDK